MPSDTVSNVAQSLNRGAAAFSTADSRRDGVGISGADLPATTCYSTVSPVTLTSSHVAAFHGEWRLFRAAR